MYLKTLRLRGFKSFAEPVELHFERGVVRDRRAERLRQVERGRRPAVGDGQPAAQRAARAGRPPTCCSAAPRAASLRPVRGRAGARQRGRQLRHGPPPRSPSCAACAATATPQYLLNRVAVRRLDVQEALADAGLGRELHAIVSPGQRRRDPAVAPGRPARLHRGGGRARQVQAPPPPGVGQARPRRGRSLARPRRRGRAEGAARPLAPAGVGRRARRRARPARSTPRASNCTSLADRRRPPAARTHRGRARRRSAPSAAGSTPRSASRAAEREAIEKRAGRAGRRAGARVRAVLGTRQRARPPRRAPRGAVRAARRRWPRIAAGRWPRAERLDAEAAAAKAEDAAPRRPRPTRTPRTWPPPATPTTRRC